eukprot:COSAG02_NODE_42710_length_382_cov_0.653710_1_plen_32_part_01
MNRSMVRDALVQKRDTHTRGIGVYGFTPGLRA